MKTTIHVTTAILTVLLAVGAQASSVIPDQYKPFVIAGLTIAAGVQRLIALYSQPPSPNNRAGI